MEQDDQEARRSVDGGHGTVMSISSELDPDPSSDTVSRTR